MIIDRRPCTTAPSPWTVLESIQGQIALPFEWRAALGPLFTAFQSAFLQPTEYRAATFPCARHPGYFRKLYFPDDVTVLAPCHREGGDCPTLTLTTADVTMWQLSWPNLARALCHALNLQPKTAEFGLRNTGQIGSWSADAVPVILTIQTRTDDLRRAVDALVARLRCRFILLSPTASLVDATAQATLAAAGSALFPLDTMILLADNGALHSPKLPGELFAQFTPQPKELDEDAARRAIALIRLLDPVTIGVFEKYCCEGLSARQTADELKMSKTAVIRRLNIIRAKTGMAPARLRSLSPYFARIERTLSDPLARTIHRKDLL